MTTQADEPFVAAVGEPTAPPAGFGDTRPLGIGEPRWALLAHEEQRATAAYRAELRRASDDHWDALYFRGEMCREECCRDKRRTLAETNHDRAMSEWKRDRQVSKMLRGEPFVPGRLTDLVRSPAELANEEFARQDLRIAQMQAQERRRLVDEEGVDPAVFDRPYPGAAPRSPHQLSRAVAVPDRPGARPGGGGDTGQPPGPYQRGAHRWAHRSEGNAPCPTTAADPSTTGTTSPVQSSANQGLWNDRYTHRGRTCRPSPSSGEAADARHQADAQQQHQASGSTVVFEDAASPDDIAVAWFQELTRPQHQRSSRGRRPRSTTSSATQPTRRDP